MFVKLLPDQVSRNWEIVRFAIANSMPPDIAEHNDKMNLIFSALLSGKLQCWASYSRQDDKLTLKAVVVTQIVSDYVTSVKSLYIMSVFGYLDLSFEDWKEGFSALVKWGKSKGCVRVTALTNSDAVVARAKSFGADASYTYISLPFEK